MAVNSGHKGGQGNVGSARRKGRTAHICRRRLHNSSWHTTSTRPPSRRRNTHSCRWPLRNKPQSRNTRNANARGQIRANEEPHSESNAITSTLTRHQSGDQGRSNRDGHTRTAGPGGKSQEPRTTRSAPRKKHARLQVPWLLQCVAATQYLHAGYAAHGQAHE